MQIQEELIAVDEDEYLSAVIDCLDYGDQLQ